MNALETNKITKHTLLAATVLGVTGIVLGAFAAHGLEKQISAERISTFEVGVRYQMYSAFFLLIIGVLKLIKPQIKKRIVVLTLIGTLFFSGSIYGLSTNELTGFDFKSIALITPIGGFLLILAWVQLLISVLKLRVHKS